VVIEVDQRVFIPWQVHYDSIIHPSVYLHQATWPISQKKN